MLIHRSGTNPRSKSHEHLLLDRDQVQELKKIVSRGEGFHLEFKRKASQPDKIAHELIAFANTEGGTMFIGVDDDKSIPGVKYPEEESHLVNAVLEKQCRPKLIFTEKVIKVSEKHFVLQLDVPKSKKPPIILSLALIEKNVTLGLRISV